MVKITLAISAAVLLVSVQAAPPCPANVQLCGSEIIDVFQCDTVEHLESITPHINPAENIRTDIYPTNAQGVPQIPLADCSGSPRGCINSNLGANPPRNAMCGNTPFLARAPRK